MWNPQYWTRVNAGLLEELIKNYKFFINNNSEILTRSKLISGVSIIDLIITTTEMGLLFL
jgi:hypothetical protein